jgi:uncharacterized protein YjiS (DUF1127 family)
MFDFETSASLPSSYELHRRARRERSRVVNALMRSAMREFAEWLGVLARGCARLARNVAAERQLRRAIRELQQFDDRTLRDIGLGRSEIEFVVRFGRPHLAHQRSLRQPRAPRRVPEQRQAA